MVKNSFTFFKTHCSTCRVLECRNDIDEADILVVTGPVTHDNRKPLEDIYNAIPNPKLVVATGACAVMGGVYKNCYGDIPSEEIEGPVENVIPVDAKIPGCAVRPQDVLAGVVASLPHLLNAD